MKDYFDEVHVINLDARPDRMKSFLDGLPKDWPFREPVRFSAFDPTTLKSPLNYVWADAVWCCLSSHYRILCDAVRNQSRRILILEDDAVFCDGFTEKALEFLHAAGTVWDGLWFGGEHAHPPKKINDKLYRCRYTIRLQMYALNWNYIRYCRSFIRQHIENGHVDQLLALVQRYNVVYCPPKSLVGQRAGKSDIEGVEYTQDRYLS